MTIIPEIEPPAHEHMCVVISSWSIGSTPANKNRKNEKKK
jgi:hypothetical protein